MRKIFVLLFVLPAIVLISGCVGQKEVSHEGVVIKSFTAEPSSVSEFGEVNFYLEAENKGDVTAKCVRAVLHNVEGSWRDKDGTLITRETELDKKTLEGGWGEPEFGPDGLDIKYVSPQDSSFPDLNIHIDYGWPPPLKIACKAEFCPIIVNDILDLDSWKSAIKNKDVGCLMGTLLNTPGFADLVEKIPAVGGWIAGGIKKLGNELIDFFCEKKEKPETKDCPIPYFNTSTVVEGWGQLTLGPHQQGASSFRTTSWTFVPPDVPVGQRSLPVIARVEFDYKTTSVIRLNAYTEEEYNRLSVRKDPVEIDKAEGPVQVDVRGLDRPIIVDVTEYERSKKFLDEPIDKDIVPFQLIFKNMGTGGIIPEKTTGTVRITGPGAYFKDCFGIHAQGKRLTNITLLGPVALTKDSKTRNNVIKLENRQEAPVACTISVDRKEWRNKDSGVITIYVDLDYRYYVEDTVNVNVEGK